MITLQQRVHSAPPPAGWNFNKLHRVFRVRKGYKNTGMREDNLLSLSYGRIIRKDIDTAEGLLPESFETYQIVEPGNIVMRLTDLQNDKRSLRQGLVKERGIITSAYDVLEVERGHDARFWAYALLALDLAKYYYSLGGGVRQSIKFSDFPNDWITSPNYETQKAIANFLDRETSRIDQLTEKKKNLSALLADKRRALISMAVSGRTSDSATMPSKSRWFDELPCDWKLMKLNWLAKRIGDGLHTTPEYDEEGSYFFVNGNNLSNDRVIIKDSTRRVAEAEYRKHYIALDRSTLLLSINGTIGSVGLYNDEPIILGKSAAYIKCNNSILREYLSLVLQSEQIQNYFLFEVTSTTIFNLSLRSIRNVPVPFPQTLKEQDHIVKFMRQKGSTLDSTIQTTRESIDRLREFRASLITAAVTGQIDVTTWGKVGETDRRLDQIEEAMRA